MTNKNQLQTWRAYNAEAKDMITQMIQEGNEPYSMYAVGAMNYLTLEKDLLEDQEILAFLDNYQMADDPDLFFDENSELSLQETSFLFILYWAFLFRQPTGSPHWDAIKKWLPCDLKEFQIINTWQNEAVFSLFQPVHQKDKLYFKDVITKKDYLMMPSIAETFHQSGINADTLEKVFQGSEVFFSCLLPSPHGWFQVSMLDFSLPNNFSQLKKLAGIDLENELFAFASNHLQRLRQAHVKPVAPDLDDYLTSLLDDDFQYPYYPTKKHSREKSTTFAKRLLDHCPQLVDFEYRQQAEDLLVKICDNYPFLFLKRGNAYPLYEAIQGIFSQFEDNYQHEPEASEETSNFWYLFIEEYFPKEFKAMGKRKIPADFWEDFPDDDLFD